MSRLVDYGDDWPPPMPSETAVPRMALSSTRRHPEAAVRREMRAIVRRRRKLKLWQKAAAWTLFYAAVFVAGSIIAAHLPMRLDFPIDHGTQISSTPAPHPAKIPRTPRH